MGLGWVAHTCGVSELRAQRTPDSYPETATEHVPCSISSPIKRLTLPLILSKQPWPQRNAQCGQSVAAGLSRAGQKAAWRHQALTGCRTLGASRRVVRKPQPRAEDPGGWSNFQPCPMLPHLPQEGKR